MQVNIEEVKPFLSFNHLLIPELLNVENPLWDQADLHILVFICSSWQAKAVSETLNALYHIAKESKYTIYFDFCYKLSKDDYKELPEEAKYFGYCSKRTPEEFDMIWTSISYLGDLPYLINFMHKSFSKPYHEDRKMLYNQPIIMLGGCIATACDLVSEYIDVITLGEGEDRLTDIVNYYIEHNLKDYTIFERIHRLVEDWDNIAYPMGWNYTGINKTTPLYDWVKPAKFYRSFDMKPFLYTYKLLCDDDITVNRTNILIGKGCTSGVSCCSFCVEGTEHGIWRGYDVEHIKQGMLDIKRTKPVETLILYAFNTNTHKDYPELFNIGSSLYNSCITTGFRGDICSEDEYLIKLLVISGNNRVGIGVEGISNFVRNNILGKRFTNEQIIKIAKRCIDDRIVHLKFNMIFTGYEEEKDWREFESLLREINSYRILKHRDNFRITLSWTTMVHYNTVPMGKLDRKALNKEMERQTPVKDFMESIKDLHKINSKFNTGAENILLQLFNDKGRLLRPYIEPYFKDSVKTLTRKYFGEIVDDILSNYKEE